MYMYLLQKVLQPGQIPTHLLRHRLGQVEAQVILFLVFVQVTNTSRLAWLDWNTRPFWGSGTVLLSAAETATSKRQLERNTAAIAHGRASNAAME